MNIFLCSLFRSFFISRLFRWLPALALFFAQVNGLLYANSSPLVFALLSEVCSQSSEEDRLLCSESQSILENFISDLSQTSGLPITLHVYTKVEEFVTLFASGAIDGGYVKLQPFLKLKESFDDTITPIAVSSQSNGSDFYYSAFITLKGKKMQWSDLQGKRIGLIKDSISGYFLPKAKLKSKHLFHTLRKKVYENYFEAAKALEEGQIDGLFAADMAFTGGVLGDPERFQFQFILKPKLPMAYFVINTQKVDATIRQALETGLINTRSLYNGEGINTFSGFNPFDDNSKKMLKKLTKALDLTPKN